MAQAAAMAAAAAKSCCALSMQPRQPSRVNERLLPPKQSHCCRAVDRGPSSRTPAASQCPDAETWGRLWRTRRRHVFDRGTRPRRSDPLRGSSLATAAPLAAPSASAVAAAAAASAAASNAAAAAFGTAPAVVSSWQPFSSVPLIAANDTWGVWTVLLACAAIGFWSERFEWGKALSGPLVSTLAGLVASNAAIIPTAAPAYDVVNTFLLPLAVPLLLLGADLRRVVTDTGRLLAAFCIGAVSTVVGTFAAFAVLPLTSLGSDGWKIAAALMSRHIGGAVNYVAVTSALEASPSVVAAGLAADNLLCAVYFTTLFALASGIPPDPQTPKSTDSDTADGGDTRALQEYDESRFNLKAASAALALAAALCFAGVRIAKWLNFTGGSIPCVTAIVVLLATAAPKRMAPLVPAGEVLAALLLQIFFAAVGAAGSVADVATKSPSLFLFSFLQIFVHLILTLAVGQLLGFSRKELLLASNANVGGPTTGAGMAAAKGWRSLLVPTVLVGIFGYAIATFLSIFIGQTFLRPG